MQSWTRWLLSLLLPLRAVGLFCPLVSPVSGGADASISVLAGGARTQINLPLFTRPTRPAVHTGPVIWGKLPLTALEFDLFLRGRAFVYRFCHLVRIHQFGGETGRANICFLHRWRRCPDSVQILGDALSAGAAGIPTQLLISVDAVEDRGVRPADDFRVVRGKAAFVSGKSIDHSIIDNRRGFVISKKSGSVGSPFNDRCVPGPSVEVVTRNDDGLVEIAVPTHVDVVICRSANHDRAMSPGSGPIIDLVGGKRHPAHGLTAVDPAHPARIPAESKVNGRRTGGPPEGRRPVPGVKGLNIHPCPVMMGDVPERFVRNPAIVAIIDGPAAGCERPPAGINPGGPPHIAIGSFIVHAFPSAVLFKRIGFFTNGLGQEIR